MSSRTINIPPSVAAQPVSRGPRTSPRILYISPFWPRQAAGQPGFVQGGSQNRSLSVLSALREFGDVKIVTLDEGHPNAASAADAGADPDIRHAFQVTPTPNRTPLAKLRWALDPSSDYPNGCGVGKDALESLQAELDRYDVVWFFKLRAPDLFPNTDWPGSVLDIDDIPSTCERIRFSTGTPAERMGALRRYVSWRRREKLLGKRFSVLSVCSEEDRDYLLNFGLNVPIHVIPNAFAEPAVEPVRTPAQPARIGFIGLMDHAPNREGLEWFLRECWPAIRHADPEARLRLVGKGSDLRTFAGENIDGLGWVEDCAPEMATWSMMVVPIRTGGGTRVKIAQGFAQKCPIVSTSFGAQGYGALDGYDMCLADNAAQFAAACTRLLREPKTATDMAERAWKGFQEKWSWNAIRPFVWAAIEDGMRSRSSAQR